MIIRDQNIPSFQIGNKIKCACETDKVISKTNNKRRPLSLIFPINVSQKNQLKLIRQVNGAKHS